jgi:hypothetical protein
MNSLALIAAGVEVEDACCVVAIEGGHGALFVQAFALPSLQPLTSVQSLAPSEAAAVHTEHVIAGSGANRLFAARGFGTVVDTEARASRALMLPVHLRNWIPSPVYGRAPDAKAAAA